MAAWGTQGRKGQHVPWHRWLVPPAWLQQSQPSGHRRACPPPHAGCTGTVHRPKISPGQESDNISFNSGQESDRDSFVCHQKVKGLQDEVQKQGYLEIETLHCKSCNRQFLSENYCFSINWEEDQNVGSQAQDLACYFSWGIGSHAFYITAAFKLFSRPDTCRITSSGLGMLFFLRNRQLCVLYHCRLQSVL